MGNLVFLKQAMLESVRANKRMTRQYIEKFSDVFGITLQRAFAVANDLVKDGALRKIGTAEGNVAWYEEM